MEAKQLTLYFAELEKLRGICSNYRMVIEGNDSPEIFIKRVTLWRTSIFRCLDKLKEIEEE